MRQARDLALPRSRLVALQPAPLRCLRRTCRGGRVGRAWPASACTSTSTQRLRREEGRSPADIRAVLDASRHRARRRRGGSRAGGRRTAPSTTTSRGDRGAGVRDGRRVRRPLPAGDRAVRLPARAGRRRLRAACATGRPHTACSSASSGCRTPTSPPPPTPRRSCAAAGGRTAATASTSGTTPAAPTTWR